VQAKGKPEKARRHEELARAIEIIERRPQQQGQTMTSTRDPTFLMTPEQHREWAKRARRHNREDLAKHHEQLARAIERIERAPL
jgi:hypothetical protein